MPDGLPDVPLSPQQDGVGTGGSPQSELVQSQNLSTVGNDPVPGGTSEAESGNGELGNLGETLVVKNLSYNDDGLGTLYNSMIHTSANAPVLVLLHLSGDSPRGSVPWTPSRYER